MGDEEPTSLIQGLAEIPPPFIVLSLPRSRKSQGVNRPNGERFVFAPKLSSALLKIGRSNQAELQVDDVSLSRIHTMISYTDGHFVLKDNDSKFQTLVKPTEAETLRQSADPITVQSGRTVLSFSMEDAISSPVSPIRGRDEVQQRRLSMLTQMPTVAQPEQQMTVLSLKKQRTIVFRRIFRPGTNIGIRATMAGIVTHVFDNHQAKAVGVKAGWRVRAVNGTAYTIELLNEAEQGSTPYEITFESPEEVAPGQKVRISRSGLHGMSELNNVVGTVQEYDPDRDLWYVKLANGDIEAIEPYALEILQEMPPANHTITLANQTITFRPGPLGFKSNRITKKIVEVYQGQAKDAGVRAGWRMVKINGVTFDHDLLDEKKNGVEPYEVTFEQDVAAERDAAEDVLRAYAAQVAAQQPSAQAGSASTNQSVFRQLTDLVLSRLCECHTRGDE